MNFIVDWQISLIAVACNRVINTSKKNFVDYNVPTFKNRRNEDGMSLAVFLKLNNEGIEKGFLPQVISMFEKEGFSLLDDNLFLSDFDTVITIVKVTYITEEIENLSRHIEAIRLLEISKNIDLFPAVYHYFSEETLEAIDELERAKDDPNAKVYSSTEELFRDMDL